MDLARSCGISGRMGEGEYRSIGVVGTVQNVEFFVPAKRMLLINGVCLFLYVLVPIFLNRTKAVV